MPSFEARQKPMTHQKEPNPKSAPADRGHLLTEHRLGASGDLDALSVEQALQLINDQDATIGGVVRQQIPAMAKLVTDTVAALRRGGRLIYVGAGTSGRLGVLDASECPPTFHTDPSRVVGIIAGGDASLRRSSEGMEDNTDGARAELERLNVDRADVVIGIAAGGTTPYVLGALRMSKQRGAVTGLISCVDTRDAAAIYPGLEVDHVVALCVGPEVVTGSTRMKAGTATKLALNMISTTTMVQLGKTWGNLMVDLRTTNAKLTDRGARIIESQCSVSRDEALALLDRAQGRVKVALVMARRGVKAQEAQRLLDEHGQRLRPILGPPNAGAV